MKCIFCEIVDKKLPADIVYETPDMLAFLDTRPLFPGHVLIVPKVHYETLWDLPQSLSTHLLEAAKKLSVAVREATHSDGIFMANNNIVSQSVPHFHLHIIPRKKKDGLKGFFWPRINYKDDIHKHSVKERIISCIPEKR